MNKRLLKGAFILTIAALFTKILSVVYRIPYQNVTGDIGFYIYQQVYPIHGIVFTLMMYGFPVVIAKLAVEERKNNSHVFAVSFFVLTAVCLTFFILLFLLSPVLANIAGDRELAPLYRTMSASILFVPFISVLRGMFQAQEYALPTALSQISEQLVRVVVIVALAIFFVRNGFSVYVVGAGAAAGSVAGAAFSMLVLIGFYLKYVQPVRFHFAIPWKTFIPIGKNVIVQGFFISIGALTFVLFQLIDSFTVITHLEQFGCSLQEAKRLKGIYDRSQPLLQLGFTLATSLSLVIVPALAANLSRNALHEVRNQAGFALKVTFIISIAASFGLAVIAEPANVMLFTDSHGSAVIRTIGFSIFFGSLALVSIAILQGMNRVKDTLYIVLFGLVVKCMVNITFIPIYGIHAAAAGTVSGFFVMAVYSLIIMQRLLNMFKAYPFQFFRIFFAIGVMTVTIWIWQMLFTRFEFTDVRFAAASLALSSVAIAVVVYGGLLHLFRIFTPVEIELLKRKREGVEREN